MTAPDQPLIDFEAFKRHLVADYTRRIRFASYPKLKRGESFVGKFQVPFSRTIEPIFNADTGVRLYPSKYGGLWHSIKDESTYKIIEDFCERYRSTVFVNDFLALSVALDLNFEDNHDYTCVGQLEKDCKDNHNVKSLNQLVSIAEDFLEKVPFYKDCSVIAAVPPRPGKTYDLPTKLVSELSNNKNFYNISENLHWANEKAILKSLDINEKWDALQKAKLECECDLTNKKIVLLDDLYQSGTTLHYVASTLLRAGATHVYGLCLVKSWRDTDNV